MTWLPAVAILIASQGLPTLAAGGSAAPGVGVRLSYDIQYQSKGTTDLGPAIAKGQDTSGTSKHDLLGTLDAVEVVTYLDREGTGGLHAAVSFTNQAIGIVVDGHHQIEREREISADLAKTVYVTLGANNCLTRIAYPDHYSSMARNFVSAVLSAQQFVVPAGLRGRAKWTTQEAGANASYSARYRLLDESGTVTRISKTIMGPAVTGDGSTQAIPQGQFEFRVTARGVVEHLHGAIHEDMLIQKHAVATQDTTMSARLLSNSLLLREELLAARHTYATRAREFDMSASLKSHQTREREQAIQRRVLGQDNVESIQQDLVSLDHPNVSPGKQTAAYLKLKALLSLQPRSAIVFEKFLETADLARRSSQTVATALAAVGVTESQDALCDAIRFLATDLRALATLIPFVGSIEQPTERVITVLSELGHSPSLQVRATALLALGTAARNLSHQSIERSNRIVNELVHQLSSATDDTANVLLALGNTGSDVAMQAILTRMHDQSPAVRRSVSSALAGTASPDSDAALCAMLKTDREPLVRTAAAQALKGRSKIAIAKNALMQAAQQDQAENVRIASMFALTDLISSDHETRTVVATMAERDPSEVVRKEASTLLHMTKTSVGAAVFGHF
jgi:HEAT repeat protein